MRYASVCSGIGTCKLAWEPCGMESVWFSEIAEFPVAVLDARFPNVPNHGDMVGILENALRRLAGAETDRFIDFDIDLLAGGCPCQAFSQAGNRLSLEDARGNLTLAFVQLVHTIDALRPGGLPVVVYENVPGILTVADNAFGCFLGGLAGEDGPILPPRDCHPKRWRHDKKSGRDVFSWPDAGVVAGPMRTVAWRVLDAQHHRQAQRRRRVVVVSCPASTGLRAAEILFEPASVSGDPAPRRPSRKKAARGAERGADGCVVTAYGGNDTRGPIQVAAALNANRGCHNPGDFEAGTLLVEPVGALCSLHGDQGHRVGPDEAAAGHLLPIPINEVGKRTGEQVYRGHAPGTGIGEPGDPAFTLLTDSRQGVAQPLAFPAHMGSTAYVTPSDVSPALESKNPTAVVQAVGFTCKDYGQDAGTEISPTMRAMNHAGSHQNAGGQLAAVQAHGRRWLVRRLMPCEYEDLQDVGPKAPGQPEHTAIIYNGKPAEDGPRYRALGNGWNRAVFEWIGHRIVAAHAQPTA